jgi:myosin-6
MSTARGGHKGTVYMVQLSIQQAQAARDALAKAIYAKLFDYIVARLVNKSIPYDASSAYYIGVLDVAGFEYFQHNSFEQLLINFCNEKLQQFFNERILREEQNIYEKEGLNLTRVEFVDNQDCLQLFEMRARGIFDLLDEESRLPKPSAQHFTQSVHGTNAGHFRLALPRASKLRAHREIRDDEGFLVRHFAGAVCYETHSFIDKNNDALHASLKSLMLESDNALMRELFSMESSSNQQQQQQHTPARSQPAAQFTVKSASGGSAAVAQNKLNFVSVASTFRSQLNDLMQKLRSTGSHFIRCVKPNSEMVAHKFEGAQILSQLHCSGMDSVLKLMQQGYPSRLSFNDLYQAYARYLPPELARLDSHLFCRALFKALGLSDQDFRFGSSKVFFRPAKFAEFDQIIRTSDAEHMAQLIERVSRWLVRSRWRKVAYCSLSVIKLHRKIIYRRDQIVRLQKCWRSALVQRKLKFRLQAVRAARQVDTNLCEFEQLIAGQLKASPERDNLTRESHLLRAEIATFIESLKVAIQAALKCEGSDRKSIDDKTACEHQLELLRTKRDLLIRSIRDKIAKQKELLRQLEQQVAVERQKRETEELARRQDEKTKQERAELEARRRVEAETAAANATLTRELVDSATDPMSLVASGNEAATTMGDEQEQRDYEIAMRLARDQGAGGGGGTQVAPIRAPSESLAHVPLLDTRFANLAKWKYSDLRDTINTSCDLELLEACKREFHRRLKVYHAWRAMNSGGELKSGDNARSQLNQQRAPSCIMDQRAEGECLAEFTRQNNGDAPGEPEQRYFRIPFLRQGSATSGGQRGWWFAHFDGMWIARQLELHPNREPILLVAGQHDIDMCELSLQETRLVSKRGAEILAREFEAEWQKHGGLPYKRRS